MVQGKPGAINGSSILAGLLGGAEQGVWLINGWCWALKHSQNGLGNGKSCTLTSRLLGVDVKALITGSC